MNDEKVKNRSENPTEFFYPFFHRLNMEVDLQSLFGLHVTWCAQLYSLAETPHLPPSPRIWTRMWGALLVSKETPCFFYFKEIACWTFLHISPKPLQFQFWVLQVYVVRHTGGLALNSDFFFRNTLREVKSKSLTASRGISKHKRGLLSYDGGWRCRSERVAILLDVVITPRVEARQNLPAPAGALTIRQSAWADTSL